MKVPLNFAIMRHWENWVVITLMLLISLIAADIIVGRFTSKPQEG